MTNCKHGNGQECQQCQYERDVASGYPEPWRLWEVSRYGAGFQGYCSSKENPLSETLTNTYRRRHDADEIIKGWEREKRRKNYKPVSVLRDEWLAREESDKCATCRHDYEPKEGL